MASKQKKLEEMQEKRFILQMHPGGKKSHLVKATEDELKFFWVDEFRKMI